MMLDAWRPFMGPAFIAVGVGAVGWGLLHGRDPAPVGVAIEAAPAKSVAKVGFEPQIVTVPLRFYKPEAKKRLNLPASVQASADKKVIAATTTPNDERRHTVTTVIDTATGEATTFDTVEPLPWIAPGGRGAVGIAYGYSENGPTAKIYAYRDLLQVKKLRLGVRADLDQYGDRFGGAYLEYRY